MIGFFKERSKRKRFIEQSVFEVVGIAFLVDGYSGIKITLSKELRLNGHPIAIMDGTYNSKGSLYNHHSMGYLSVKKLISEYVFHTLSEIPKSPSDMVSCEKKFVINKRSEEVGLGNRRAMTLVDVNWEEGDWARPNEMQFTKYPELEKLVFNYKVTDALSELADRTGQSLQSYPHPMTLKSLNVYLPT